ncbi:UDP-glucuronate 4-epimerase 6-like [Branchiostoma floridae]|uniref:UDP-glucuronate 4-epimerase 6-like n=1 Tax=Branchiostoma floridae TaxID=7739 RepID=A0A9J7MXA7_BRAFL|nr:UDP-glucuronate 4-epimerase 6-like [Branchiostoma floridae]
MRIRHVTLLVAAVFLGGISVTYVLLELELSRTPLQHLQMEASPIHQRPLLCSSNKRSIRPVNQTKHAVLVGGASFMGYHLTLQLLESRNYVTIVDDADSTLDHSLKRERLRRLEDLSDHKLRIIRNNACSHKSLEELFKTATFSITHVVFFSPLDCHNDISTPKPSSHVHAALVCFTMLLGLLKDSPSVNLLVIWSKNYPFHHIFNEPRTKLSMSWLSLDSVLVEGLKAAAIVYHNIYGHSITGLELSEVYGPYGDGSCSVIHRTVVERLHHRLKCRPMVVARQHRAGNPSEVRDFLHVTDAARGMAQVLDLDDSCAFYSAEGGLKASSWEMRVYVTAFLDSWNIDSNLPFSDAKPNDVWPIPGSGDVAPQNVPYDNIPGFQSEIQLDQGIQSYLHWFESHSNGKCSQRSTDVILATYFVGRQRQQHRNSRQKKPGRFEYMKNWYWSVIDRRISAVVFHDSLESEFVNRVENGFVSFQRTEAHFRWNATAKYYVYLRYLKENSRISRVILTDISDVRFQKNPFELMDLMGDQLYVGTDVDTFPNIAAMGWLRKRLSSCFNDGFRHGSDIPTIKSRYNVYNAGVIGGSRELMLQFLEKLVAILDQTTSGVNCNLAAVNYVLHGHFDGNIYPGFPWTSRFLRKQKSPKGVYIIHK